MHAQQIPFWQTTAPSFESDETPLIAHVDVAIIGGGYTGLSAARSLAKRGASVAVLEAATVGWGASSRNGGMVLTGLKKSVSALSKTYGRDLTRRLFASSLAALNCVEEIVTSEQIDCDFTRYGHLEVAAKQSHYDDLQREAELLARDFGHQVRMIPQQELCGELGSTRYFGGLIDELSAGVNPARYVVGLAHSARRAGALIYESVRVDRIIREGTGFLLGTTRGSLLADNIFVATNGYTSSVTPALQRRVIPVGSYIIATDPLPDTLARELIPHGRMVYDTKNFLYYFRLTPDQRMLFGGRAIWTPPNSQTLTESARILREGMIEVFPQLKDANVAYAWGGTLGFTFDLMPHAGQIDGMYYALGYAGHGVALATYLGARMAELISGEAGDNPFIEKALPRAPLNLYTGNPWFLPFAGAWYRFLDWAK